MFADDVNIYPNVYQDVWMERVLGRSYRLKCHAGVTELYSILYMNFREFQFYEVRE